MRSFEDIRLYAPEFTHENRLPPRATVIPSLRSGVFYKNKEVSELILDLNGDYRFCYREKDDLGTFFAPDYDDSAWDILPVPSMWQYHGYSEPVYPNIEYPIPLVPPYVGNKNPVPTFSAPCVGNHKEKSPFTIFLGVSTILQIPLSI